MVKPYPSYFGGKSAAGVPQTLINLIPPIKKLIVGFAGNCSVLANMKLPESIIICDLDKKVLKDWEKIFSRDPNIIVDDTSGNLSLFNEVHVKIINENFITLLQHHQKNRLDLNQDTLLYLDPPYPLSTRTSGHRYKHELTDQQHGDLLSTIKVIPAKVMICSYENEMYNTMLADWNRLYYISQTRRGKRKEVVFFNYPIPERLHDYSYIGSNFRERERIKKKVSREIARMNRMKTIERNAIIDAIERNFKR